MPAISVQPCAARSTATGRFAGRVAQASSMVPSSTAGLGAGLGASLLSNPRRSIVHRRGVAVRASAPEHLSSAVVHAVSSAPSALDHLAAMLTPYLLTLGNVADGAAASDAAQAVSAATEQAAPVVDNGGVFGWLASSFEAFLKVLDNGLENLGVPYAYGFSIILLTILVKAATYPLSKQQVESTISMQALQPRVKELQAKFANNPERLQMETARLYKEAGVNPLAGCLPTLATIPVWIGLYKALSNVADEGLLTEGFFWIPSLGGPATLASQQAGGGLSWLFPFQNGAPPVGWTEAAAYLVLPVLLVISQYVSQKIMSPSSNSEDPSQAQAQAILKFLPLMIGWFSLNVPSGLTLYWFTNNLLTTAQSVWLRRAAPATATAGGTTVEVLPPLQSGPEEPVRVTGKDVNARRSKKQIEAAAAAPEAKQGGSRRGEKFKQIKAREAARKAAKVAASSQPAAAAHASSTQHEAVKVEEKIKVPDTPPSKENGSAVESAKE